MIESVKFWNEPNNKSHWDFEVDPEWRIYVEMVKLEAQAVKAEKPGILRVLGEMSPIDANFPGTSKKRRRTYYEGTIPAKAVIPLKLRS